MSKAAGHAPRKRTINLVDVLPNIYVFMRGRGRTTKSIIAHHLLWEFGQLCAGGVGASGSNKIIHLEFTTHRAETKRSHMSIAVAHGRINKMADSHGQKKGPFRNPCPMPGPYSVGHPFPIPFALAHNDMSSAKCKTGRHRTFRQLFVLVVDLVLRLLVLLAPRPCCTYNFRPLLK